VAIFYSPPEPRQAYPRVLPVTGGAQPRPSGPRGGAAQVLAAIGVWAAIAATPMPAQKPLNVVPLTLKYGQQPPVQGPLTPAELNVVIRSWDAASQSPPPMEGTAGWNVPSALASKAPFARVAITWPLPDSAAQKPAAIAPLTLVYGQQPCAFYSPEQSLVRGTWEPPCAEPPAPVKIAPLTLAYGQQPPTTGPLSATQQQILGTVSPWWLWQSENDSAAWNVPAPAPSFVPFTRFQPNVDALWWNAQFPSAVLIAWNQQMVLSQGKRWIAPFAGGVVVVETDALTGIVRIMPALTGVIHISSDLTGVVKTGAGLEGMVSTGPQLKGIVQIGPRLTGKIIILPS
jgi:hypothetical protein